MTSLVTWRGAHRPPPPRLGGAARARLERPLTPTGRKSDRLVTVVVRSTSQTTATSIPIQARLHFGSAVVSNVAIVGLEDVAYTANDIEQRRAALDHALVARDDAIHQAFAEGFAIGVIAEAAKLTPARVGSILGHPHQRVGRPSRPPRTD